MPCQRGEYRFRQERIFVEAGRQNGEAGNSPADCFLARSGQDPSGTGGKKAVREAPVSFPVNPTAALQAVRGLHFQVVTVSCYHEGVSYRKYVLP